MLCHKKSRQQQQTGHGPERQHPLHTCSLPAIQVEGCKEAFPNSCFLQLGSRSFDMKKRECQGILPLQTTCLPSNRGVAKQASQARAFSPTDTSAASTTCCVCYRSLDNRENTRAGSREATSLTNCSILSATKLSAI
mmetsp:Transcript_21817/g.36094  ORF Transcript_21817/g.36094 Transcript_21817/m.36094 type:complete len:137 (-) Transcript_21817:1984-2394(-)